LRLAGQNRKPTPTTVNKDNRKEAVTEFRATADKEKRINTS